MPRHPHTCPWKTNCVGSAGDCVMLCDDEAASARAPSFFAGPPAAAPMASSSAAFRRLGQSSSVP
eukprot:6059537-Lingulodinium_polyedra.AAC.1